MKRKDRKLIKIKRNSKGLRKLTVKEALFKNAYLLNGFNAKRAHMEAYQHDNGSVGSVEGYTLLRRPAVKNAIDKQLTSIFHKMEVSNELIIAAYVNQAFYDERAFFDEDGMFVGMQNLNIIQQACIESLEVFPIWKGKGKKKRKVGEKTKIRFYSRKAAMDSLAKYKGLITDAKVVIDNRKQIAVNVDIETAKEFREALGDSKLIQLHKLLGTKKETQEAKTN